MTNAAETDAQPKAVLFDAYGTLFDVHSVVELAERHLPGYGASLSQLWRDRQIEYSRLCSMSGRWRPFSEITRAGLRQAALRLKLALAADVEAALMAQYQALAPYAENAEVLRALCARGVRCGILSNGDRAMLEPLLRHCRFEALIDPLLCAETVRRFKTDSAVYDLGPRALGLRAEEILFVSSNGWDAIGATWYGYTTLWVNRSDAPLESLDTSPTRIGRSLRDVLDFFSDR
ncbi:MAG: haloacid dehalogenase type II [Burkholderiaceae bacterium]|nr:haloacid dehalogenase type II [Burkholderiaceae bacterium]